MGSLSLGPLGFSRRLRKKLLGSRTFEETERTRSAPYSVHQQLVAEAITIHDTYTMDAFDELMTVLNVDVDDGTADKKQHQSACDESSCGRWRRCPSRMMMGGCELACMCVWEGIPP